LEYFIGKVKQLDPDLIVCHGMTTGIFEVLINRLSILKIAHWSWLGRFKRTQVPRGGSFGGFWLARQVTVGRLICDTFTSAKELIRETNYNLTELSRTQLQTKWEEFDLTMLVNFYKSWGADLLKVVNHTERDAFFTMELMMKL